jgi:hypothetical protein
VHDSHDRYASRGIDYLLQRIGSSPRLVVLATRATQDLDAALLRRLHCIDLTG